MATFNKYHAEVLRILDKFKKASEWPDFIEPLDSLCATFKKYNAGYVPCIPQLIKRLNQLLNPVLPGGIHIKTIDCYNVMLDYISNENLIKDFDVLTIGLFNFSVSCRIIVANKYLDLLEKIVKQLGSKVDSFSKNIIFGFLPFLESESSDFYTKAYNIMAYFSEKVPEKIFFEALWINFIDYPDLRISILNFLNNHKLVVIPDYNLVTKAFCLGLEGDNPFIIRPVLEISNRDFPFRIDISDSNNNGHKSDTDHKNITDQNIITDQNTINDINTTEYINKSIGDLKNLKLDKTPEKTFTETSFTETNYTEGSLSDQQQAVVPQQIVKNIISESVESESKNFEDKSICNSNIIRGVLKIFLKKEVGMHKRAYKWLNILDTFTERDIDYIEKGLRTYLDGTEEELCNFFRIVNTLADKENLIVFLMDRLILDAIKTVMEIDEKRTVESLYFLKKNIRLFLNYSLDEYYRVIYMKLNSIFENLNDKQEYIEEPSDFELESSSDENIAYSNSYSNYNEAEQLINLILYSLNILDAVDQNVISIHLPLLCHLIIKNKNKISHNVFTTLLEIFLEKCEGNITLESKRLSSDLIKAFYQKEVTNELLEISLIGAIAKELGLIEIYRESNEDAIFWADSTLTIQDGVLVWSEAKNVHHISRAKGKYFNFCPSDIQILQKFIQKFGFKDFSEQFLKDLGKYLAYNYKFIDLINTLGFYIDHSLLRVNLWNDFILSQNPKYLAHFEEEFLLPFILEILPTVSLKDICLFLKETLKVQKFYELLLRIATIVDHRSADFLSFILEINDTISLIKFILDRYHSDLENQNTFKYDQTAAILFLLQNLVENEGFIKALMSNNVIHLEKFGNIGIKEALINMLISAMISNQEARSLERLQEITENEGSVIFDYSGNVESTNINRSTIGSDDINSITNITSVTNIDSRNDIRSDDNITINTFKHPIVKYKKGEVDLDSQSRLSLNVSTSNNYKRIYQFIFNIFYKLHKKTVNFNIPDIENVKKIIFDCRKDFYILKKSLFLLGDDVEFIYRACIHYYKPILYIINEMSIRESFFMYLLTSDIKFTVDEMIEAVPYLLQIKTIKKEHVYKKCFDVLVDECINSSALYQKIKGYYRKIDNKLLAIGKIKEDQNEPKNILESGKYSFEAKLKESEISLIADLENKTNLPGIVLVKSGELENIKSLISFLYNKNPSLFVNTMPNNYNSLYIFGIVPFKADLYERLLVSIRIIKLPIEVFQSVTKLLSPEIKESIIKSKAEYIRNIFGIGELNAKTMCMLLELFKSMPSSELLKVIISNILQHIVLKIEKYLRLQYDSFDEEFKILKTIIKHPVLCRVSIAQLRTCCFSLLGSKESRESALDLIHTYLKSNPNCRIFIDAFINHFYKNFFDFGTLVKKSIFYTIASSPNFDAFAIINNLIAGLETSIFSTAQSEEIQRISNLKRMSFLILSQPKNKFSSMSDAFVKVINDLIGSSAEVKIEAIRLSSALILKIDHHYIQTLFPILVADFMITVFTKDLRLVLEIFKFIDISVWLNSSVFVFKSLFVDNHSFFYQLRSQINYESSTDFSIDMQDKKLPNFLAKAFPKISSWSQLTVYLDNAAKYYNYIEFHMVNKDYEAVEEFLILCYKD